MLKTTALTLRLALSALLITGLPCCSATSRALAAPTPAASGQTLAPLQPGDTYVSLGSSYAAGPGVGTEEASVQGQVCARSTFNYAHQLAALYRVHLVDAACSGAQTQDILTRAQHPDRGVGPQILHVTPDTRLVTITVGGNDVNYVGTLTDFACLDSHRARCGTPWSGAAVESALQQLPGRLDAVVGAVRERAPQAQVVLLGYLPAVPASIPVSCAAALPLSAAHAGQVRALARRLARAIGQAAHDTGAAVVPSSLIGAGHEVCSEQPYLSGDIDPVVFHPNLAGMTRLTAALDKVLSAAPR